MIRLGPPKGAFYYLPWRRRQFKLAGVCQLVLFRPHASSLRKEAPCRAAGKKLPKGNPWKGFSGLFRNQKGRGPFEILGVPDL